MGDKRVRESGAETAEDVYRHDAWGGLLTSGEMAGGCITYGQKTNTISQLAFGLDNLMYTKRAGNQGRLMVDEVLLPCT